MMVEHAPPPEKFDIQPRTTSYPLSSTNVKPLPDLANAVAKGKEMVGRAVDSAKELVSPGAAPIGK
jgi:hypothetical protein